jgi:hypothetical protein
MRTPTKAAATAALLAAIAGGSFIAAAIGPAFADRQPGPTKVIALTAETEQFAVIDVGTPGPALGLGDQIISSDRLFRKGKPVGTDGVVCTIVKTSAASITCQWTMTLSLPEGQLTLQAIADGPTGPPTEPTALTLAITGGTGAFHNTHGAATIVDNPGGSETITLKLSH